MNIDSKTRLHFKLQSGVFYLLIFIAIILLAQFSLKTNQHYDWTANSRNSLSDTSKDFLKQLNSPVTIQAFISPNSEYKSAVTTLLNRYQYYNDDIKVSYIDPDFAPDRVRELGIQQQGEMVVSLGERQQHVFDLSEQSLTNALINVSRQKEQWLVFIEGHGERTPLHQANFNLATWGETLEKKGFKLQSLNLVEHSQIPANTAALVIASPERAWLDGEIAIVKQYIADGGNLLWLSEPNTHHHLSELAEQLAIEFVPGIVIDPNTELLGISDPQFALVTEYANHPISEATSTVTLFPHAAAVQHNSDNLDWQYLPLLTTADNTWSEQPSQSQTVTDNIMVFDEGQDTPGPLTLAYLLTRPIENSEHDRQQRIAVIGDGDFLSNSYIGNGANIELGLALMNWLAEDDELINIPVKTTLDNQLELTQQQSLIIGLGFLVLLPVILLTIGSTLWWYRRKR